MLRCSVIKLHIPKDRIKQMRTHLVYACSVENKIIQRTHATKKTAEPREPFYLCGRVLKIRLNLSKCFSPPELLLL